MSERTDDFLTVDKWQQYNNLGDLQLESTELVTIRAHIQAASVEVSRRSGVPILDETIHREVRLQGSDLSDPLLYERPRPKLPECEPDW